MRYAIISDIHSNKQALNAVLADIEKQGVDEIFCLGDLVGYGPSPNEVIDIARSKIDHFILGNHDAVIAGYINANNFNLSAKKLIEWTILQLDNSAINFFKDMPLTLVGNNVRFSHSEFKDPGRFGYIIEDSEALDSFNSCDESLLLTGHSHIPGIFVIGNSGTPHWLPPQNFGFEKEKRYIVNVGSVGQPRDEDIRASYCIVDKGNVLFYKVPFDVAGYRDDLIKQSLPVVSSFVHKFEENANKGSSTKEKKVEKKKIIKPHHDFSPLSKDDTVKIKREVKNLKDKVVELNKSKKKLLLLVLLLTSAVAIFATLFTIGAFDLKSKNSLHLYKYSRQSLPKKTPSKNKKLLLMPTEIKRVSSTSLFHDWQVSLFNPTKQKVSTILEEGNNKGSIFFISSTIPKPIQISSIPIVAKKEMRFNISCGFRILKFDSGFISILIEQQLKDGSWKTILTKDVKNLKKSDKWGRASSLTIPTKNPLENDGNVRLTIQMRFSGEVLIRRCQMKRK